MFVIGAVAPLLLLGGTASAGRTTTVHYVAQNAHVLFTGQNETPVGTVASEGHVTFTSRGAFTLLVDDAAVRAGLTVAVQFND